MVEVVGKKAFATSGLGLVGVIAPRTERYRLLEAVTQRDNSAEEPARHPRKGLAGQEM